MKRKYKGKKEGRGKRSQVEGKHKCESNDIKQNKTLTLIAGVHKTHADAHSACLVIQLKTDEDKPLQECLAAETDLSTVYLLSKDTQTETKSERHLFVALNIINDASDVQLREKYQCF